MSAVLLLGLPNVIEVTPMALWLLLAIFFTPIVAAVIAWIVTAKTTRARLVRVVATASTLGVTVPLIFDCGWWQWLCDGMI